jgi:hypothetical protein
MIWERKKGERRLIKKKYRKKRGEEEKKGGIIKVQKILVKNKMIRVAKKFGKILEKYKLKFKIYFFLVVKSR